MAHSLIDRNPKIIGVSALVLFHNADWSGDVEIRWTAHPKAASRCVKIDSDKLLNGIIDVDLPMHVAARAVALACQEYAIMRVRESVERIEFKPGSKLGW